MAWLVTTEARVLASAEIADCRSARRRGLLGRAGVDGAFIIPHCKWVHTIGMKFPIDVAYVDKDGVVVKTSCLAPHRVGVPVPAAACVIEAQCGAFDRWGLKKGDTVELRDADTDAGIPSS